MARKAKYLLPRISVLKELSDEKVKSLVELSSGQSSESTTYAMIGMLCGTMSFLACVAAYVYLVKGTMKWPQAWSWVPRFLGLLEA